MSADLCHVAAPEYRCLIDLSVRAKDLLPYALGFIGSESNYLVTILEEWPCL